MAIDCGAN
jgi:cytochrome d ubiquinol oxidase subunit I